jgi:[ribosomal protein S5]-alanine N-acetyltransferase
MMAESQPILITQRLILRPLIEADARDIQRLAGDWEVSDTTQTIPYPYPDGAAEQWIESTRIQFQRGAGVAFAITLRDTCELMGVISLGIRSQSESGEIGYWVGKPYWNLGYASEAAMALLDYGFNKLNLSRMYARHLSRNPASGRVMQKIGMQHEGHLRQHEKKWGVLEDVDYYGILRAEYLNKHIEEK